MDITRRRELASRLLDGYVHGPAAATEAKSRAQAKVAAAEAVMLVEGISDQIAVETLAARRGRDLGAERVVVLPIGGAHAITRYLRTSSSAVWPAPVWVRPGREPTWSDWVSTSPSRTWRTS